MLSFLILVMKKMILSDKLCCWVKMLYYWAKTRYILNSLTKAILVSFSLRQGAALSMLLYVIYIEPFLLFLGRRAVGLRVAGIPQCVEALEMM